MSGPRLALVFSLICTSLPAAADAGDSPPMLAPNIGTGQLISDIQVAPHKPTLPPELASDGKSRWGLYKICVSEAGAVSDVSTVKSANEAGVDLDSRWMETIKGWRYRPYVANGKAHAFCYTLRLQLSGSGSGNAQPGAKMVAPNIGTAQLLTDVNQAPHKPRLPPELNKAGNVVWGLYKICVSDAGDVLGVRTVKPAHESADGLWMQTIKTWKYRPYSINGKAVPFCYTLRLQVAARE